uniref:PPPDE domain-containing protein n=1 Tax=Pyrodinium bahamense TaxID=73915 RepID=A0A7S0F9U2_9DINO|mmetsp:Transcript_14948/g.41337  ORF Transcript_14948/g.41337 Transcript_14948/m.41337 type:complete len:268 (+) Transcript_14948:92-895(+)
MGLVQSGRPVCGPLGLRPRSDALAYPTPVTLHVYNCGKSSELMAANAVLRVLGTGAFHCGVEVHDREWGYESTGIFCCWPRQCTKHNYFESVPMGETFLTEGQVLDIIRELKSAKWDDTGYDILEHNCCHFADALCRSLGVGGVPTWVTNLALAGVTVRQTLSIASCGGCCGAFSGRVGACEYVADPQKEDPVHPEQVKSVSWDAKPNEVSRALKAQEAFKAKLALQKQAKEVSKSRQHREALDESRGRHALRRQAIKGASKGKLTL